MLELAPQRKNKINLADYNVQQDIESRILLSQCSVFELEVLEAILFSSLKIPIKKLALSLDKPETDLLPILQKLARVHLIQIQDSFIQVDKERRKNFEFLITRFEEGFKPNIDFLQGLLKQVPISILPLWYSIPRSSNNIFESLTEKYLFSPQIYERYLEEIHASEPLYAKILDDLFSTEELRIPSQTLMDRHNLSRPEFEETLLHLEFRFAAFATYQKDGDQWKEWIVPFSEWQQHLLFLKETQAPIIQQKSEIRCLKRKPFSFVEDLGVALELMKKDPMQLDPHALAHHFDLPENDPFTTSYLHRVFEKLVVLKLAERRGDLFFALDGAKEWLQLPPETRAAALHRNPQNRLLPNLTNVSDRNLREAENIVKRVLHGEWVFFDDVFRGALLTFSDETTVKKSCKPWKAPSYTEEEKNLIKRVLFTWLFECGMVLIGTYSDRDCFCVTPFGQTFFED